MTERQANYLASCRRGNPGYLVDAHERPGGRLLLDVSAPRFRRPHPDARDRRTLALILLAPDATVLAVENC